MSTSALVDESGWPIIVVSADPPTEQRRDEAAACADDLLARCAGHEIVEHAQTSIWPRRLIRCTLRQRPHHRSITHTIVPSPTSTEPAIHESDGVLP